MECPEGKIVSPAKKSTPPPAQDEFSSAEGAVEYLNDIENILVESFGASGISLHEKISSIESALPQSLRSKLRVVATIYSKAMHGKNFEVTDAPAYEAQCLAALTDLRALSGKGDGWRLVDFVFLGISGYVGFSIVVRNFGLGAGIIFAGMIVLFCTWILWNKVRRKTFRSKQKNNINR